MCHYQIDTLKRIVIARSMENLKSGSDGFISAQNLHFDTGLNPRTVIRQLNTFVTQGLLEHRQDSLRKPHFYRLKTSQ
ncbi:hypothetical protein AAY84_12120 [Serratia marcescens]|nr:hypothetical protein AAY84_12120 [Serratia marcescens]